MSKKRYFNTKFWSDGWVVEELNPLDRYVFLYFLLNERTTLSGAYELPLRTAANETGIDREELTRMLNRLYPRVIASDGWIILSNAIKHQNYHSPKIETAMLGELDKIPKPLLRYINLPLDFAMERGSDIRKAITVSKKDDTVSIQYTHIDIDLNRDLDVDRDKDISGSLNLMLASEPTSVKKSKPMVQTERVSSETLDGMFGYWESIVGYAITSKKKQNREYAGKLFKEYSKQEVASMVQAAALASEDQYAPGISDFIDLYRKWDKLKLWGKKQGGRQRATAEF